MITYKQEKTDLGNILVIYDANNNPIGNLSFVGKHHADCILRSYGIHPVAFPCCDRRDITQEDIEKIAHKYLGQ